MERRRRVSLRTAAARDFMGLADMPLGQGASGKWEALSDLAGVRALTRRSLCCGNRGPA